MMVSKPGCLEARHTSSSASVLIYSPAQPSPAVGTPSSRHSLHLRTEPSILLRMQDDLGLNLR
jgi:hypothetical protein